MIKKNKTNHSHITFFFILFLLFGCLSVVNSSSVNSAEAYGENTENLNSPIGTNLSVFSSYAPEWGFVDAFVKTHPWFPYFCSSHTSLTTDSNDWVTALQSGQCATTYLFRDMKGQYPGGEYVLFWEGDGSFTIEQDGDFSHTQGTSEPKSNGFNRRTFNVSPSNEGLYMEITSVAKKYLKNFRLIMPGGVCGKSIKQLDYFKACKTHRGGAGSCSANESCYDFEKVYWDRFKDPTSKMNKPKVVFHPEFLQRLRKYRGIRYMQWMSTDNSRLRNWSDRASLNKQTFGDDAEYDDNKTKISRGMPYEIIIALSNVLNADAWLNIPAQSTDNFNTQFATLVKKQLNSNSKITIEYSNEVWNTDYDIDRQYMIDQANLRGISGGTPLL